MISFNRKNCIRHTLSQKKKFASVPRPLSEPGAGSYWTVCKKASDTSRSVKREPNSSTVSGSFVPQSPWQMEPYFQSTQNTPTQLFFNPYPDQNGCEFPYQGISRQSSAFSAISYFSDSTFNAASEVFPRDLSMSLDQSLTITTGVSQTYEQFENQERNLSDYLELGEGSSYVDLLGDAQMNQQY